jgi:TctA family transporter
LGEPPRHPQTEDPGIDGLTGTARGTRRRRSLLGGILVIAIAIGLVALIVLLHLTGTVGPGAH